LPLRPQRAFSILLALGRLFRPLKWRWLPPCDKGIMESMALETNSIPLDGPRIELLGLSPEHLGQVLMQLGEKPYRAKQLAEWIYKKKMWDFAQMSNLSKALRAGLQAHCQISALKLHERQVSKRDGTAKYLFQCADGELIESVFLPHEGRSTACISTQVGCAMGCRFCATGLGGLSRNLSPAEIIGQVLGMEADQNCELDNLVYMGMGEPFSNWDHVEDSITILLAPEGRAWGKRKITLSTCGVVSGIEKLAASGLGARLAISLHAPNDAIRDQIMPVNKRWNLETLMKSCRAYQRLTGLQLTFEYTLFKGINDHDPDAHALAALLKGVECKINLIPYNLVEGLDFQPPDFERVYAFQTLLKQHGLTAMLRTEKGGDIDAACGQLRRHAQKEIVA
jgi:23S rRNA (adenine2503-C2)-methyltransferase